MLCDFCSLSQLHNKNVCRIRKRSCNRFELSDVFFCKRLRTWSRILEYCNHKILHEMDGCSKECLQYIEMMKIAHEHLHSFPYLKRLRDAHIHPNSKVKIKLIRRKG